MAELIVALDLPDAKSIAGIVDNLASEVSWYKVGLELFTREGAHALTPLVERKKRIFLDLKFHDIPRTVERAIASAARLGVSMLTVHASGGKAMLKAAANAVKNFENPPILVAVTTLTSLDAFDFRDLGIARTVGEQALALADMALAAGIDGLVTSVLEAPLLRENFGSSPVLVTPGIRPTGSDSADQKRIATPAMAVKSGSDYLVVGRPIIEAPTPILAAKEIIREMRAAKP